MKLVDICGAVSTGLIASASVAIADETSRLAEPDSTPPAQVIAVRAKHACFSDTIRVTGLLVAREIAVVTFPAPGLRVVEVLAAEGDRVIAGQTLVRLTRQSGDDRDVGSERSNTTLKAPDAGVITRSAAVVGATMPVRPAEPLFRIAIDSEIELEVEVPSIHIPDLSAGQPARVQIGDRDLAGRVRRVPTAIDPKTQLGTARVSLEGARSLRIGTLARASIAARRSCGVSVPRSAVHYLTKATSVQVVRENVIETRRVQVGLHSGTATEIRNGLREGDVVVAHAGSSLRAGDEVTPIIADASSIGQP